MVGAFAIFALMASAAPPPPAAPPAASSAEGEPAPSGTIFGSHGLRPYLGLTTHLDVDPTVTPVGGTKFLFGADYLFGGATGFVWAAGLRLGAGGGAVLFQPLFELHYRWASLYPLVPWLGGGVSLRAAIAGQSALQPSSGFNLAIGGRIVAGVEYFASDSVGIGIQFALPDLGVRVIPKSSAVGTLEVVIGPHFRF